MNLSIENVKNSQENFKLNQKYWIKKDLITINYFK